MLHSLRSPPLRSSRPHRHTPSLLLPLLRLALLACTLLLLTAATPAAATAAARAPTAAAVSKADLKTIERIQRHREFFLRRAAEPRVHRLTHGEKFGKHEILFEIVTPAEEGHAALWARRVARGLVRANHPRLPPVCAAGITPYSIMNANNVVGVGDNDGALPRSPRTAGSYEARVITSSCLVDLEEGTVDSMLNTFAPPPATYPAPPSENTTSSSLFVFSPYADGTGNVPTDPHNADPTVLGSTACLFPYGTDGHQRDSLQNTIAQVARYIPEHESWLVDIPYQLAYGYVDAYDAEGSIPTGCRIRAEIRVTRVVTGHTPLAECREELASTVGYDPHVRDRERRVAAAEAAGAPMKAGEHRPATAAATTDDGAHDL